MIFAKFEGNKKVPTNLSKEMVETLADYICINLLDSISKTKKWNNLGRESIIYDINYLRGRIEGTI